MDTTGEKLRLFGLLYKMTLTCRCVDKLMTVLYHTSHTEENISLQLFSICYLSPTYGIVHYIDIRIQHDVY